MFVKDLQSVICYSLFMRYRERIKREINGNDKLKTIMRGCKMYFEKDIWD